jgi:hypothetical protein
MRVVDEAINNEIGSDAIECTNTMTSGCSDAFLKSGVECEVNGRRDNGSRPSFI